MSEYLADVQLVHLVSTLLLTWIFLWLFFVYLEVSTDNSREQPIKMGALLSSFFLGVWMVIGCLMLILLVIVTGL